MGARISVSFKNGKEESVALFHHWGGEEFKSDVDNFVEEYIKSQKKDVQSNFSTPQTRMDPQYVMVAFIAYLATNNLFSDSLYLGKDENDGDNSDEGHYQVDLNSLDQ